jgi:hypothetical protein
VAGLNFFLWLCGETADFGMIAEMTPQAAALCGFAGFPGDTELWD